MAHKTLAVASICHRTGFYDGRSVSKSVAVRA
jgi:hypothetical protein